MPLQNYIYPAGGDGLYLVVNEQGNFIDSNFERAMSSLQNVGEAGQGDKRGRKGGSTSGICF